MTTFFMILRAIRAAYHALRAAVSIVVLAHGTAKWVANKRAAKRLATA